MVLCRGVALLFPAATIAAPIPGAALCRNRQAESMALISSRSNYVRCYIAALRRVVHAVLSTDIVSDPSKHCTGGEVLPGNSREGGGRQRRIASGRCRGFSQNSELVRPRAWCWVATRGSATPAASPSRAETCSSRRPASPSAGS